MQSFRIVSSTTSSTDDDFQIVVRCIGAVFHLSWSSSDLAAASTVLHRYHQDLQILKNEDGLEDELEIDIEEIIERLKAPFHPLMAQLAPDVPKQGAFLLYDYLYPPRFWLQATLAEESPIIQPTLARGSPLLPLGIPMGSRNMTWLRSWVPNWCSSREIEIVATEGGKHPLLYGPSKVLFASNQYFFKGCGFGFRGTRRELATFRGLHDALIRGTLLPDVRVCHLHGLVVDTTDNSPRSKPLLVGMLLTYIKAKHPGILGTLQYVAREDSSRQHLRRWADDLEATIRAFHEAGCCWGDAKPENVLVDEFDNLHLIDFGGGYTAGWVDKDHEGTKDGDLGALSKMKEWLYALATPAS